LQRQQEAAALAIQRQQEARAAEVRRAEEAAAQRAKVPKPPPQRNAPRRQWPASGGSDKAAPDRAAAEQHESSGHASPLASTHDGESVAGGETKIDFNRRELKNHKGMFSRSKTIFVNCAIFTVCSAGVGANTPGAAENPENLHGLRGWDGWQNLLSMGLALFAGGSALRCLPGFPP